MFSKHCATTREQLKFWIEPVVALEANYGLQPKQVAEAQKLVEEHLDDIRVELNIVLEGRGEVVESIISSAARAS